MAPPPLQVAHFEVQAYNRRGQRQHRGGDRFEVEVSGCPGVWGVRPWRAVCSSAQGFKWKWRTLGCVPGGRRQMWLQSRGRWLVFRMRVLVCKIDSTSVMVCPPRPQLSAANLSVEDLKNGCYAVKYLMPADTMEDLITISVTSGVRTRTHVHANAHAHNTRPPETMALPKATAGDARWSARRNARDAQCNPRNEASARSHTHRSCLSLTFSPSVLQEAHIKNSPFKVRCQLLTDAGKFTHWTHTHTHTHTRTHTHTHTHTHNSQVRGVGRGPGVGAAGQGGGLRDRGAQLQGRAAALRGGQLRGEWEGPCRHDGVLPPVLSSAGGQRPDAWWA
jgi:hypothetical protein